MQLTGMITACILKYILTSPTVTVYTCLLVLFLFLGDLKEKKKKIMVIGVELMLDQLSGPQRDNKSQAQNRASGLVLYFASAMCWCLGRLGPDWVGFGQFLRLSGESPFKVVVEAGCGS